MSVGREFMSVYERFGVVGKPVHGICVMSFRKGLAGADGPLRVFLCVERELYKLLLGGTSLGVNMAEMAGIAEKSGKSGRIFFLVLVVTL